MRQPETEDWALGGSWVGLGKILGRFQAGQSPCGGALREGPATVVTGREGAVIFRRWSQAGREVAPLSYPLTSWA